MSRYTPTSTPESQWREDEDDDTEDAPTTKFGLIADAVNFDTIVQMLDDPATAELANYLVMKGGTREQVLDWNVAKNQRGDTIFIDPVSGRIFRSKPEVARFLGLEGPQADAADVELWTMASAAPCLCERAAVDPSPATHAVLRQLKAAKLVTMCVRLARCLEHSIV